MVQKLRRERHLVVVLAVVAVGGLLSATVFGDHCHSGKGTQGAKGAGTCKNCPHAKGSATCGQACQAAKKLKAAGIGFLSASTLSGKIKSGQPPVIVNVLPVSSYTSSRIKGSISIPANEIETLAPQVLPDKNAEIVVYCGSYKCGASIRAATALKSLGYTNVHDYKGGLKEWTEMGLPLEGEKVKPVASSR